MLKGVPYTYSRVICDQGATAALTQWSRVTSQVKALTVVTQEDLDLVKGDQNEVEVSTQIHLQCPKHILECKAYAF